jgi:large subunit ribosomal protein L9
MKVILRKDTDKVGKRGDIVEVAEGYARNFLLPKGHAIKASDGAVAQAASMRRARDLRDAKDREAAETIAKVLVSRTISIKAKAGSEGRLFGSVTASDVAEAIKAQTTIDIDRRKLHLDQIKTLGNHQVSVRLHSDVEFPVTIDVVTK